MNDLFNINPLITQKLKVGIFHGMFAIFLFHLIEYPYRKTKFPTSSFQEKGRVFDHTLVLVGVFKFFSVQIFLFILVVHNTDFSEYNSK